ncbi:MAG: hypothetical protein IT373_16650 [Polyangiaceae bacterium]|nr:hypothetical protein [Polyangiaceae bacterium]
MSTSRAYLSPGMFGFAELAAYAYFEHLATALRRRYARRGRTLEVRVCEVHPTSSVRRRAATLAEMIAHTSGSSTDPIHILGHSTGGLDGRLVASPSVHLDQRSNRQLGWRARLRSVTTLSTPHYGTPLATFFATAKGQRLLYAISALTVAGLKLGSPPLAAASALVAALGRTSESIGVELALVDRMTEGVVRLLDEASGRTLRSWLRQVRDDQGGIVQLMPEAMDLFEAGVEDRPGVRYQCVAAYAPIQGPIDWMRAARSPWRALSGVIFNALARITGRLDARYPCAPQDGRADGILARALGAVPPADASDGVVPLRSQLWGELVWVGLGDHLDVVGHFPGPDGHTDWLASGAGFDGARFDALMDRVAEGMWLSE